MTGYYAAEWTARFSAVPLDIHATGVDFAASATYKWLMGDFGARDGLSATALELRVPARRGYPSLAARPAVAGTADVHTGQQHDYVHAPRLAGIRRPRRSPSRCRISSR